MCRSSSSPPVPSATWCSSSRSAAARPLLWHQGLLAHPLLADTTNWNLQALSQLLLTPFMTTRCCNGPVYVMIMWLLLVASPAQCSRQLLEAARASTTLDEGKFKVKFCILKLCPVDRATFARASTTYEDCYCCMNGEPPLLCYDTMDICQAICPTCNPRCPDAFVGPTERN